MEQYIVKKLFPKTQKIKSDAAKGGYEGQDLFILTCNWSEIHRHKINYGRIPEYKEKAVEILIYMQEEYVQDEQSLKEVKGLFSEAACEEPAASGAQAGAASLHDNENQI